MIKTEVEWEEDGEGTTILSGDNGINNISDNYLCPMLREEETGIIYLVKDCPFYIGSAGGNQLEIQDKTVSREHAIILESIRIDGSEGYTIQDMNSTNGTWINDKKMRKGSQAKLKDGTIIRFAQKEYKFFPKTLKNCTQALAIREQFWYHIRAFRTGMDFPPCGLVFRAWWRG